MEIILLKVNKTNPGIVCSRTISSKLKDSTNTQNALGFYVSQSLILGHVLFVVSQPDVSLKDILGNFSGNTSLVKGRILIKVTFNNSQLEQNIRLK